MLLDLVALTTSLVTLETTLSMVVLVQITSKVVLVQTQLLAATVLILLHLG